MSYDNRQTTPNDKISYAFFYNYSIFKPVINSYTQVEYFWNCELIIHNSFIRKYCY